MTIYQMSAKNRDLINQAGGAVCFHCFSSMPSSSIEEWCDGEKTAICPDCGVDSLLPHLPEMTREVLEELNRTYF